MYVAVKGGERAIEESWRLLEEARRGDPASPELQVSQIMGQLRLAVARVMTEGSIYDEELAALALKQASGDVVEAIFLVRAYRTTLARFGATCALSTDEMRIERRISATFKDLPGGQLLGPTYDYTQRLLDFTLLAAGGAPAGMSAAASLASPPKGTGALPKPEPMPRVLGLLDQEGLIEQERPSPTAGEPGDLSREPLKIPADRRLRLQNLARADEGFLLALGYSTQRGYGHAHPFAGEIRLGWVALEMEIEELDFPVPLGDIQVTECQMINQFKGSRASPPQFTQGYGLAFGHAERKAMAMALVDRALRAEEFDEAVTSPAQDQDFVLSHSDNVEASGFVQHLKLPHYVDFQSELNLVRALREAHGIDTAPQEANRETPADGISYEEDAA